MSKNAEFERCADFLARMIEKYGDQVILPKTAEKTNNAIKYFNCCFIHRSIS